MRTHRWRIGMKIIPFCFIVYPLGEAEVPEAALLPVMCRLADPELLQGMFPVRMLEYSEQPPASRKSAAYWAAPDPEEPLE